MLQSVKGGKRIGSGRKPGVNDGRKQVTVRIKAGKLASLGQRPALAIRRIVEAL
jgi:hypothetical protein